MYLLLALSLFSLTTHATQKPPEFDLIVPSYEAVVAEQREKYAGYLLSLLENVELLDHYHAFLQHHISVYAGDKYDNPRANFGYEAAAEAQAALQAVPNNAGRSDIIGPEFVRRLNVVRFVNANPH